MDNQRYFDREHSWLEFNARVLQEGMDFGNPLLERLKFLGIVSSNFDEFFMVRMPGLSEGEDDVRDKAYQRAFFLMEQSDRHFIESLVPELARHGIKRVDRTALTEEQRLFLRKLFDSELMPLLTPIAIREERPLPDVVNLSLYLALQITPESGTGQVLYAIVEIPRHYSRMIVLPSDSDYSFILLEDVVALFSTELFPGYQILGQGMMRVTRAAELTLDEENDEDFAKVLAEALQSRRRSHIVRMEVAAPDEIAEFLKMKFKVRDHQIYRHPGWFDMKEISRLSFRPGFEDLKLPPWTPKQVPEFQKAENIWKILKERDILVQHPYQSFDAFASFLAAAAEDPDVFVIKQTLYRVAKSSRVMKTLERAAENGKQVTVLIELKARFDEANNIEWANRLVNAGATVLYGVAGLKTHAKACLVVRREAEGVRRYLHLSTGNYNEQTAQIYSDIGFFTSREDLTHDVASFFNVITGFSNPPGFSKIAIAPYGLRRRFDGLISREILRAQKDRPGLIMAKINSLVDSGLIESLYKASKAGVRIRLNVRGICCLRPGVPGLSENIEVVSVVDMFLEHSRIFYFYNGGEEEVYLSSADWMPRNLDRRLEMLFPVENGENKAELIELLNLYFKDNIKAWRLMPDGRYGKKESPEKRFRAQEVLCRKAAESEKRKGRERWDVLDPQKPKLNPKI